MKKRILVNNLDQTQNLGKQLGNAMFPGAVLLLEGDLGAGKTTLTKAIGQALGVTKVINSPTFTIMKTYQGELPLYHMDLYRMDGLGSDFDLEEYIGTDGVAIIEWASKVPDLLPPSFLRITIHLIDEDSRVFTFEAIGDAYEAVLEGIV